MKIEVPFFASVDGVLGCIDFALLLNACYCLCAACLPPCHL